MFFCVIADTAFQIVWVEILCVEEDRYIIGAAFVRGIALERIVSDVEFPVNFDVMENGFSIGRVFNKPVNRPRIIQS